MSAIRPGTAFGVLVLLGAAAALVVDAARSLPDSSATATAAPAVDGLTTAEVTGFAFPAEITVGAGGTVRWHNADSARHTVTAADESFRLDLPAGTSAELTFPTAGAFAYVCEIHPSMRGEIVVGTAPAKSDDRGGYYR